MLTQDQIADIFTKGMFTAMQFQVLFTACMLGPLQRTNQTTATAVIATLPSNFASRSHFAHLRPTDLTVGLKVPFHKQNLLPLSQQGQFHAAVAMAAVRPAGEQARLSDDDYSDMPPLAGSGSESE